mmetsp:Transcript_8846/g.11527  ORF Transcript_8846/g.11527 Transcript_8846/m.11527 type:complete len:192 (+) Transcript_8846:66-641(+)
MEQTKVSSEAGVDGDSPGERQIVGDELKQFLRSNPQVGKLIEEKLKQGAGEKEFVDTTGRLGISTLVTGQKNDSQLTIFSAASKGRINDVEEILSNGKNVNAVDADGLSPLHWASDSNQLEMVRFLLGKGANVNLQEATGQTPLHLAMICGFEDVAQVLIDSGSDVHVTDSDGNTPIQVCDDIELLKRLGL